MKKPSELVLIVTFLFLTSPILQVITQPVTYGESIVDLRILKDNSVELNGTWSKPIRPWEMLSYLRRGIPLSSDLIYACNLSMTRSGDKLRGKLAMIIYPRINPREVRPDLIKEFQARNQLTKSRIADLLAVLYGENVLIFYGIETEIRDVNVTSMLYGNLTVTMLMVNATVESSAKFIDSLCLRIYARRMSENLYVANYLLNLTTSPIPASKEHGVLVLDLKPVVNFFPPDTVATIKVNLSNTPLQLTRTDPEAILLSPQYAEILYVPIERDTLVLYLHKVTLSMMIWFSILASLVIVTILIGTRFFRIKPIKLSLFK
ncbi:MAG TPA: hypothetical protein ENG61_03155 [Candidatus Korarchaeota archaeon]|nr:hypothetical protein [Candidatus Korarchaeota archaeon]